MNKGNKKLNIYEIVFLIMIILTTIMTFLFGLGSVYGLGIPPEVSSDMVLYYHFNKQDYYGENETYVYDFSGKGNNGTVINNAKFNNTEGYLKDGAFEFNASLKQAILTNRSPISNNQTYTLMAWAYFNDYGDYPVILSIATSTKITEFISIGSASNQFRFLDRGSSVTQSLIFSSFNLKKWYHIVVSRNETTANFYINGVYIDSLDLTVYYNFDYLDRVGVGVLARNGSDMAGYFDGLIDEVIIFNRSLTDKEIKTIYNQYSYIPCNISNLTNQCLIINDITLRSNEIYNFNGSDEGVFIFNEGNLILNCNGSKFIGNYSSNKSVTNNNFLSILNKKNITIKNCYFENYYKGILSKSSNGITIDKCNINNTYVGVYLDNSVDNVFIKNSVFGFSDHSSIYTTYPSGIGRENITINNNIFNEQCSRTIRIAQNTNATLMKSVKIENNFVNSTCGYASMYPFKLENVDDVIIKNNSFYGKSSGSEIDTALSIRNTNNANISFNYFYHYTFGIEFIVNKSENISIFNNTFRMNDVGIFLKYNSTNINIFDNKFINTTDNLDAYDTSIVLSGGNNIHIYRNNFSQIASYAIWGTQVSDILIENNNFETIPISERFNYRANDLYDIPTAIGFTELLKSIPQVSDSDKPKNHTFLSTLSSNNITIRNNKFDPNTQVFLTLQGASNVTHDLNNYWYVKFNFDPYLKDSTEMFISNNFKQLSHYSYAYISNHTRVSYRLKDFRGNISINKDFIYFVNTNLTETYISQIFNQTNVLFYFSNGSGIMINDKYLDVNITLKPSKGVYIFNNYNCSENLQTSTGYPCGRERSPIEIKRIDFYKNKSKIYEIISLISENITVPFVLEANCSETNVPIIFPKNQKAYVSSNYSCSNGLITIYDVNLSYSVDSNNIMIAPGEPLFVNYALTYNTMEQNGYEGGTMFILKNLAEMVLNFFSLTPFLGSLLAIAIIIIVLTIIIIRIKNLNNQLGESEDTIMGD